MAELPFRGRGRGVRGMARGSAVSPGRPAEASSSSGSTSSDPPVVTPAVARLSISSHPGQGSGTNSSSSSSGLRHESVSSSRGIRGNRARSRSTSPVGARGTVRGFRHAVPPVHTRRTELTSKTGKNGKPIQLKSNYFVLEKAPSWNLSQYKVHVKSTSTIIDNEKVRKAIVRRALAASYGKPYIFTGDQLYSSSKVEETTMELTDDKDPNVVHTVILEPVAAVSGGDYVYVAIYNLLLRKFLKTVGLQEINHNFFDVARPIEIPDYKLTIFQGFDTSVRQHESQVLLCVESRCKVIRNDSVLDNIRTEEKAKGREAVNDLLMGAIVMTMYNKQTYKIASIVWDKNPEDTFDTKAGPVTYKQYYKSRYNLEISDSTQPLLLAELKKTDFHRKGLPVQEPEAAREVLLVPEFCNMTGLSDQMRSNFTLMRELAKYLHQGPQQRIDAMRNLMKRIVDHPEIKQELAAWSIGFEKDVVKLPGRILPSQQIIFHHSGQPEPGSDKADWTMAFRKQKMLSVGELKKWTVLVPQRDAAEVDNLIRTMDKVGRPLGLPIPRPEDVIKVQNPNRSADYIKALESIKDKKNDLIFVVLGTNKPDVYGAVKNRLTGEQGAVSQCFLAKNLRNKGLMSIATKVVIQINAKLGGEPWTLKWPIKNMMVVGFDVYHGKGRNCAGMVASIADTQARFYSTVSFYDHEDDIATTLQADMLKCLNAYKEFSPENRLPSRIMFYRDGVSDGQLSILYNTELNQLTAALRTAYNSENMEEPKMTYIVVNKKINTRLFTADPREAKNPPPGTVVDDVVTLPERYDFYLIPQAARQGAVSPSSYNIIYDTQGLDPDKIQAITFRFCHMYFNWSGTVAVPAPCQYAHKLANLVGLAVGREPHQKLSYNLHFL